MNKELAKIEKLFEKLINAKEEVFPEMRGKLSAPEKKGVYLIINPKNQIVHVGNTPRAKKGIAQRLKNHINGSSSFKYHFLNGDGSKLRGKYKYKCLVVENPRNMVLLEAYAIAHLCPKHLGVE